MFRFRKYLTHASADWGAMLREWNGEWLLAPSKRNRPHHMTIQVMKTGTPNLIDELADDEIEIDAKDELADKLRKFLMEQNVTADDIEFALSYVLTETLFAAHDNYWEHLAIVTRFMTGAMRDIQDDAIDDEDAE